MAGEGATAASEATSLSASVLSESSSFWISARASSSLSELVAVAPRGWGVGVAEGGVDSAIDGSSGAMGAGAVGRGGRSSGGTERLG